MFTTDHGFAILLSIVGVLTLAWQGWLTWTMLSHEKLLAKLGVIIDEMLKHCVARQTQGEVKDKDDKQQVDALFSMIRRTERNIARIGSQLGIKDLENPQ